MIDTTGTPHLPKKQLLVTRDKGFAAAVTHDNDTTFQNTQLKMKAWSKKCFFKNQLYS